MDTPRPTLVLPTREGVSPSCVVLPSQGQGSLLDFLAQRLSAVSRDAWQARMQAGEVVDERGEAVTATRPFEPGLRVYYYRSLPSEPHIPFEETVVYRDEHLLVADKPHFMPVTPSGRYVQQSLLVQLKRLTGCADLVPLHRIDRETAGLVLLGKRLQDRDAYHALFREHQIHKTYHAVAPLLEGLALPRVHTSRLAEDPVHFFKMREVPGETNSETRIALMRSEGARALYQLEPVSGKRHQLRVHMMGMGIPIEGDQFYPQVLRGPHAPEDFGQPLQLLAHSVEFTDPLTGLAHQFTTRQELLL